MCVRDVNGDVLVCHVQMECDESLLASVQTLRDAFTKVCRVSTGLVRWYQYMYSRWNVAILE